MNDQASFSLRGRNPDVLSCIANLSNDEVFTPPELANRMLDELAGVWANSHGGANIWADKNVRFLDPCTKSGVFLREITMRLTDGLAYVIPDLNARVDHILTQQVFGIGITKLTSLLARRSLYCSKHANGEHSIANSFQTDAGNIWFDRVEHSWQNAKCEFCGTSQSRLDRGADRETHAYAFIHTDDIFVRTAEMFGVEMQFDVIIGNPPYQLQDAGDSTGASPIYHHFIRQAMLLNPRYISMITPSRWFAGGKGLDSFRKEMLNDPQIRTIVDFTSASDCFPGVDIAGGVSYFLWERGSKGDCNVINYLAGKEYRSKRPLNEYDTFIRYGAAVPILRKVVSANDGSLGSVVSSRKPFGLATNIRPQANGDLMLYWSGGIGPFKSSMVLTGIEMINKWKTITSKVSYDHGGLPGKDGKRRVLSKVEVLPPKTICTETYIVAGCFDSEEEAINAERYLKTSFVRFLVSLLSFSQDITRERFFFVPNLPMDKLWTDEDLYHRYGLSSEEIDFIEMTIKPME